MSCGAKCQSLSIKYKTLVKNMQNFLIFFNNFGIWLKVRSGCRKTILISMNPSAKFRIRWKGRRWQVRVQLLSKSPSKCCIHCRRIKSFTSFCVHVFCWVFFFFCCVNFVSSVLITIFKKNVMKNQRFIIKIKKKRGVSEWTKDISHDIVGNTWEMFFFPRNKITDGIIYWILFSFLFFSLFFFFVVGFCFCFYNNRVGVSCSSSSNSISHCGYVQIETKENSPHPKKKKTIKKSPQVNKEKGKKGRGKKKKSQKDNNTLLVGNNKKGS